MSMGNDFFRSETWKEIMQALNEQSKLEQAQIKEAWRRAEEERAKEKEAEGTGEVKKKKATPKVMRLIDPYTGEMECKICGSRHFANLKRGGGYYRGAWQCVCGCKIDK